ncbi:MAG TPA: glycosyl hydrolase-related protein [Phototrophicaceae bacterium]|nr:glycosyl hydrolase-related protein [Phototrophicaceae bacterium]
MADAGNERVGNERTTQEMAMLVLATLHVVPYLRLEREGEQTFEAQRAHLLDILNRIAGLLRADGGELRHLLLGGQTVLLEDIAALRPEMLTFLIICNSARRIELGPWYIQVDNELVSGEALIRNLLAARADADRHGIHLATVAYTPDPGGHTGQLPQILQGFGIDAVFLHHGAPVVHLPFRWESPDGSSVLVISHDTPQRQNAALSVRDQRVIKPDGPFLWMSSVDQPGKLRPAGVPFPILLSNLATYVASLRQGFTDDLRPALKGELRLQGKREGGYLLPGTASARIHLKQQNAALESQLTHVVEPLLALATTLHKRLDTTENLRALLAHAWRTLMKNQSRAVLGGYASDAVYDEVDVRYRQVEEVARQVIHRVMEALPGVPHSPGAAITDRTTVVTVWNSHNWDIKQVVELILELPNGLHPVKLTAPNGRSQAFGWQPQTRRFSFLADAPPVGYAAYSVMLGEVTPPDMLIQRSTATTIAGTGGTSMSAETGELVWHSRNQNAEIRDLFRLIDGGDAGDVYNYSPPHEDVIEQATLVSGIQAESSPVFERLILRHRMRIAPSLRADRRRDRGVRLLEFTTSATFYDHTPGIYFHTDFVNTAEDHRLRVHLRTGIHTDSVLSDAAFGLVERPAHLDGAAHPASSRLEGISNTYPMQGICAVQDENAAMALVARGLPEFEAIQEDNQTTLALTLLRSVGWISRSDLLTRTATIGDVRAAPSAQCLRPMSVDYALMPLSPHDPPGLMRASQMYQAPLQAFQYNGMPDKTRRSYLSIQTNLGTGGNSDGNGAILTAFKPPMNGRGWVLRLFNPTNETVEAHLTPGIKPKYARVTNLAEDPQHIIEPDGNGTLTIELAAQKIVTLRVSFH